MNTILARAGSNCRVDACFLAIKQSLPCGCVQFRRSVCQLHLDPPLGTTSNF